VGPRTGLDDVEKRRFLPPPGLELRPLGRPARSQSLYRLRIPAPNIKVDNPENYGPTVGSGCNAMSVLEGMKLPLSYSELNFLPDCTKRELVCCGHFSLYSLFLKTNFL
jgi:hypothetical protein